jgi:hypothetical protein
LPGYWTVSAGFIRIYPTPAAADTMRVFYYVHPAFDSADDDVPPFDDAFHTVLVDWALCRLWEQEEDMDKSGDYRAKFEMKLSRMTKFYNTEMLDRPMVYGGNARKPEASNMPWLEDARLSGTT